MKRFLILAAAACLVTGATLEAAPKGGNGGNFGGPKGGNGTPSGGPKTTQGNGTPTGGSPKTTQGNSTPTGGGPKTTQGNNGANNTKVGDAIKNGQNNDQGKNSKVIDPTKIGKITDTTKTGKMEPKKFDPKKIDPAKWVGGKAPTSFSLKTPMKVHSFCMHHTYWGWTHHCWLPTYNCCGYWCPYQCGWYYWYEPYCCYLPVRVIMEYQPVVQAAATEPEPTANAVAQPPALPPGAEALPIGYNVQPPMPKFVD